MRIPKISNKLSCLLLLLLCYLFISALSSFHKPASNTHIIDVKNPKELQDFFLYTSDRIPFISSHRGGPKKGLPENCIATFENTLQHTWSILEIDPHYTKDSAIVLMHDATLDRTSNGQGKVSDYTLADIRKLRLKDTEGNVTSKTIPTLDEVLEWAKGKTILIIDQKDVSTDVRVQKIKEHHAEANAMVMAYSLADAKRCYELDKNIMMEAAFVHDLKSANEFDKSGVPWKNVVVFVTHTEPKEKEIFEYVHNKGAMCIRGSSRTIDKDYTDGKISSKDILNSKYQQLIKDGADIIEADLGVEAGQAIEKMQDVKSGKRKYFKLAK
jgi:glycerophosphoryl diester phosphodiesterase